MKKYKFMKDILLKEKGEEISVDNENNAVGFCKTINIRDAINCGFLEEVKETLDDRIDALFVKHDCRYSSAKEWRKRIKKDLKKLFK